MKNHSHNRIEKLPVELDADARIQECKTKVEAALAEYNCGFDVSILVTQQGNAPQLRIVVLNSEVASS